MAPALIVIGVVAVVVIGGVLLALLGSSGAKTASSPPLTTLRGTKISAEPARSLLAPIVSSAQPPSDVIAALYVPSGAKLTGSSDLDRGLSTYDRSVTMKVSGSVSAIVGFYKAVLAVEHWGQISTSPTPNGSGTEIFARHSSNDGYYWEVGAVVTSANPTLSPALAGGSVAPTSTVVLRIFEVNDEE
jgi:hypothetical protein